MYKNNLKQVSLLPCLLVLSLMSQNAIAAVATTQTKQMPGVPTQGTALTTQTKQIPGVPAQGTAFTIIPPPQLTMSLQKARNSLLEANGNDNRYILLDTNGDKRVDSFTIAPANANLKETLTLDQAIQALEKVGGNSNLYMTIDTNGDGKVETVLAVTY